jgi:hypothetical protein
MTMLFHPHHHPVTCLLLCTFTPLFMWALMGWLLLRIMRSPQPPNMGPTLTLAVLVPPTLMATVNGLHRLVAALQA